ncbi:DoxX-like family protein [Georgenia satyanarayanai]|uniref:DoxX-like family protein n=1 Tax=Georgenia satyanarayanai TaxID=860221 RepID=A0A2Y9AUG8_9MICO|nr:DoxX family protein [Georgenia satyanarayanai]PYF97356.1 DoxX-like protein [Georgenia satyanarayanai]SSA46137.1 DoxX-like family protein [Georgenia satyanarayanai]
MEIARTVLAALTCLLLLVAALNKVTGQQSMHDMASHLGIAWPRYRAIGVLELAAVAGIVIGLWWTALGVAAGAGVVLLMVGAVVVHARVKDPLGAMVPALALLVLAAGYTVTSLL